MKAVNYSAMSLNQLRRYVLTHREDDDAFQAYVNRSKTTGRMISIDLSDTDWEENLGDRIQQTIANQTEAD